MVRKDRVDGPAIEGGKVDGFLEETQRHRRMRDVQNDGISNVRNGNSVANAGRPERFASDEKVVDEVTVFLFDRHHVHDASQDRLPGRATDAVVNSAELQRVREMRLLVPVPDGAPKFFRRHPDAS